MGSDTRSAARVKWTPRRRVTSRAVIETLAVIPLGDHADDGSAWGGFGTHGRNVAQAVPRGKRNGQARHASRINIRR